MPHTRKKPRTYTEGVRASIMLVQRWNYCQKIAQLYYKGTMTDEQVIRLYQKEAANFVDAKRWKQKSRKS